MEKKQLNHGINSYFHKKDKESADIVEAACEKCIPKIKEILGLPMPEKCSVYLATSYINFIFFIIPFPLVFIMAFILPLYYFRGRRVWQWAAGLCYSSEKKIIIGVKPLWLLEKSDKSLGEKIYVKIPELQNYLEHIICHEMAHAFCSFLKLPSWINEGMAMMTAEQYYGVATVKKETLQSLDPSAKESYFKKYPDLSGVKKKYFYRYVLGYWFVKYLLEKHPEFLREMLEKKEKQKTIKEKIASELDISLDDFYRELHQKLFKHFQTQADG